MLRILIVAVALLLLTNSICLANQFTDDVKQTAGETKQAIKQSGKSLKEDVKKGGRATKEAFKQAGKEIGKNGKKIGTDIRDGLKQAGHEIKDVFKK